MMDGFARVLGYIVIVLLAAILLVVALLSLVELVSGNSDDRKCQELAEATGGTVTHLQEWGDCQVEWEGFYVTGGRIERRYP